MGRTASRSAATTATGTAPPAWRKSSHAVHHSLLSPITQHHHGAQGGELGHVQLPCGAGPERQAHGPRDRPGSGGPGSATPSEGLPHRRGPVSSAARRPRQRCSPAQPTAPMAQTAKRDSTNSTVLPITRPTRLPLRTPARTRRAGDRLDPFAQFVVAQPAIIVDDRLVLPEAFGHRTHELADGNLAAAHGRLADPAGSHAHSPPPRHTC